MNALKLKKNQKGFTLMEMLIVVAIIAVLVAILIPTVTASLNKSKEATDIANLRAAYAETQMNYMSNPNDPLKYDVPKLNFPSGVASTKSGAYDNATITGATTNGGSVTLCDAAVMKGLVGKTKEDLKNDENTASRTFKYYANETGKTYTVVLGPYGEFSDGTTSNS